MPATFEQDLVESEKEFRVYWGTHVLLGLNGLEWDGARVWKYNSALLADADGANSRRYDKMHLVPFGEYVPLGDALPFMHWFTPYENDYSAGPANAGRDSRSPIDPAAPSPSAASSATRTPTRISRGNTWRPSRWTSS